MRIRTIASLLLLLVAAPSYGGLVSRVHTFSDGAILTAAQLNAEFNNIINGVNGIDNANLSGSANIAASKINAAIAGNGITRDAGTGALSCSVDDATIEISGDTLRVKALGIGTTQLADSGVTLAKLAADVQKALIPVGTLFQYGGNSAPDGYLMADGSEVLKADYSALFAVYGTTYNVGGEQSTHFRLPDMRGRVPVGAGTGTGLTARVLAAKVGEETHALSIAELATHAHTISDPGHGHLYSFPNVAGTFNWVNGPSGYGTASTSNSATGITINNTGSGTAHNTMQPSLVLNYIIKY